MRRREFLGFAGAATVGWPADVFAQQRDRLRSVGVLMGFAETDEVWQTYLRVFRERLHDFGWTNGQSVKFEYRFAGENAERTRQAAAELVGTKPDLLFVTTNPALSALLQETRTIPIVFTWVSDSVGSGYVRSLAHPGGNVTGFRRRWRAMARAGEAPAWPPKIMVKSLKKWRERRDSNPRPLP